MKTAKKKSGMSLPEILTSIMIVALLVTLSMPAVKAIYNSFSSTGSAEVMINAALSNARAIAMSQQKYVGVRFQKEGNPVDSLNAAQYMVFIVHDPKLIGTYGFGFKAVEGLRPIKLPDNTFAVDMFKYTQRNVQSPYDITKTIPISIINDGLIDTYDELMDTSCFSIIFSPQGNVVIHGVTVWLKGINDDVFNNDTNVNTGNYGSMFYYDDFNPLGLGIEPSRRSFVICEQDKFRKAYEKGAAYTGYLSQLIPVYINSYTGTIISAGQ